jgi:Phage tail tube protein
VAIGTGTAAIAAFKQKNHTTEFWDTPAINVNTTNTGLYILGDTMGVGVPEYVQDESLGSAWESTGDSGNLDVAGDINADLRYDGPLLDMMALVMGAAAAPAVQAATAAYNHVLTLTDTTDGLYGTYAVYDGVAVREAPSLKVNGWELSSAAGQPVKLRLMVTASDRVVTGTVNPAPLSSVTYVPVQPRAMFDDIRIRINSQASGALADSDTFYASAWTLTFQRPMVYAHVTNLNPGVTEGVADGKPTLTLALTEDRYTTVTRITECRTKVAKKVDISMTGPTAAGAYPYKILFEMPQLLYEAAEYPMQSAGKIIPDLTLRGQKAATAPAGMTSPALTLPLRMTVTSLKQTIMII